MNRLGRTIEKGEVVVVAAEHFEPDYQAVTHRQFRCKGGFGMHSFTTGSAIFGEWLAGGSATRIEGYMIDPAETAALTEGAA